MNAPGLFDATWRCRQLAEPGAKCSAVEGLLAAWDRGELAFDEDGPVEPMAEPGRPEQPRLVDPAEVPRRRLGSREGRVALVHAIAHIEFNAINLALDAVYRFRGMPRAYYGDWLSVAADEARHFRLLCSRLESLGAAYGDLPAHNGLWEMAEATADRCLVRMALVPRVLEARGLDVTPGMIERLRSAGDGGTVEALELILREEVRHVEIGTRWFRYCCEQEGLEPTATFLELLETCYRGQVRGPFNLAARKAAGFSDAEMAALSGVGTSVQSGTERTVSGVTSR